MENLDSNTGIDLGFDLNWVSLYQVVLMWSLWSVVVDKVVGSDMGFWIGSLGFDPVIEIYLGNFTVEINLREEICVGEAMRELQNVIFIIIIIHPFPK